MLGSLFLRPSPRQAVGELVVASVMWGFAFIAVRWSLTAMGPLYVTAFRFFIALVLAAPIFLLPPFRAKASLSQFWLAMTPGFLLGGCLVLQGYGLHYTTVTKSGFITVLYLVFVPMLERIFFKRKMHWGHWLCVGIAMLGTALICQLRADEWNRGDAVTLVAAFLAALHILKLDLLGPRIESSFTFNVFQSFWAGLLPLVFAIPFDTIYQFPPNPLATAGLLVLSLGATLFSFMIQVRTQQVLASAVVSMLFVLESPFAAFFAYLFVGEYLTMIQWIGAALILLAAVLTIRLHVASVIN